MQEKGESGKWEDLRLLGRPKCGGESYIRLQKNSLSREIVSAQHLKEDVEQTPENKGGRGNPGGPGR